MQLSSDLAAWIRTAGSPTQGSGRSASQPASIGSRTTQRHPLGGVNVTFPLQIRGRALCLALVLAFAGSTWAEARDLSARPITNLFVFGDSLSDSGNLLAVTGNQRQSPPYFEGRFSDGPVWVESLAPLLDLEIDFEINVTEDPLANDQAFGGAQSGFGSNSGAPVGLLSQIENFAAAGGGFEGNDLIVVRVGANDYFSLVNANPARTD